MTRYRKGYWDDGRNGHEGVPPGGGWRVDPGRFDLYVGYNGFTSWSAPGGLKANVTVAV